MKRILALTLSLASILFVASTAEAKTSATSISPATTVAANSVQTQWQYPRWGRRYNRRVRVVTQTRLVRYGRRIFRETYRIAYLPNGRTRTTLVSRVRVR